VLYVEFPNTDPVFTAKAATQAVINDIGRVTVVIVPLTADTALVVPHCIINPPGRV